MNLTKTALIEYVASGATLTPEMRKELADTLRQLYMVDEAFDVWQEKTEWVQETSQAGELGLHRADVLRQRIEKLEAWKQSLEYAMLSMKEMTLLLNWYTFIREAHPLTLRAEDKALADKVIFHIEKATS